MVKKKSKIKVCFVVTRAYPLFNEKCDATFGGSEVQIYNVSRELAKNKNFDVYVVVGDFGQDDFEEYDGVKVVKSFSMNKRLLNYMEGPCKLYKILKRLNCDVVVQRGAGAETGICAFYCKRNNKKFTYSVAHDIDVNGVFAKNGFVGKMFNYGLENSDFVVAQNKRQVDLLKEWKGKDFLNIDIIKSSYNITFQKASNEKEYVLWVGRSDEWKRPELFLKLAKKFPEERFVMIMPKSSNVDVWEKYSRIARSMKNIKFIEKVPFSGVQKYFNDAIVFVNTSDYEGFPNTFVQACLGGAPILGLNVNPDNFILKNKIGLFANGNFDKMVESLGVMLTNKKSYKEFSLNSYYYVKQYHDIENNIKKWVRVIEDVSQ